VSVVPLELWMDDQYQQMWFLSERRNSKRMQNYQRVKIRASSDPEVTGTFRAPSAKSWGVTAKSADGLREEDRMAREMSQALSPCRPLAQGRSRQFTGTN
jgi:hypothetical protein